MRPSKSNPPKPSTLLTHLFIYLKISLFLLSSPCAFLFLFLFLFLKPHSKSCKLPEREQEDTHRDATRPISRFFLLAGGKPQRGEGGREGFDEGLKREEGDRHERTDRHGAVEVMFLRSEKAKTTGGNTEFVSFLRTSSRQGGVSHFPTC